MKTIGAEVSNTNAPVFGFADLRVGHIYRNKGTRELYLVVEVLKDAATNDLTVGRPKRLLRCGDFREVLLGDDRYEWVGELHVGEEV